MLKRSQTAIVTSKKTLDYSSRDIVNAREWFKINTGLILPSDFTIDLAAESSRKCPVSRKLLQVHHQQLGFCHFLDGVAQTFTSQSGILYPTVRHVINPERGHVARH